jgi:hypothetical protein
MKIRLQPCPECLRKTPHFYQPASLLVLLALLCLMVWPGLIYRWYTGRRADRTARCAFDHTSAQGGEQANGLRELMRAIEIANGRTVVPRKDAGLIHTG